MSTLIIRCTLLFALFAADPPVADPSERTSYFNQKWLDAVVSIEQALDGVPSTIPEGTGFLVGYQGRLLLVTAKHVVVRADGQLIQGLRFRRGDVPRGHFLVQAGRWLLSKSHLDLAVVPVGYSKGDPEPGWMDLTVFITRNSIQVGAPVLVLGYPAGVRTDDLPDPLARSGTIARVSNAGITLDAAVFPGNSGGPVVYVPWVKVGGGLSSGVVNSERLIGMIVTSQMYRDPDRVGSPRTFIGLGGIVAADEIRDFIVRNVAPIKP